MTDIYDRAQELEQRQREEALARQAGRQRAGAGLSHCEDCGDEIPQQRREKVPGCTRCVSCQSDVEKACRR
ncbi:TraR/DksA family transcriptional regulator [Crenobacter luteus]|uniref:TraR/DksA family transcriptional regulator n=1 Tax=Crenobacter luteus TaxID=1452487 RepID=UPI0010540D35|nr:TraR/DksA family transcriptional regulator [Crenobacter luteus]TCP13766.1 TraR/DksA family transcriptional regulator [Crenobacter luteus]